MGTYRTAGTVEEATMLSLVASNVDRNAESPYREGDKLVFGPVLYFCSQGVRWPRTWSKRFPGYSE